MKVENYCEECDKLFNKAGQEEFLYCPFCGNELVEQEEEVEEP